jgi:cytochrome c oxidase cbb3-type subunit 3
VNHRPMLIAAWALLTVGCGARDLARGRPSADSEVIDPDKVVDFSLLFEKNCSGCHGANGKGGAAIGLSSPIYLAIADDETIRRVTAGGVAGTSMPAFAQQSGGMLTTKQIDVIVHGIRTRWARPNALGGSVPPPYAAQGPGDADRGADVYETFCSSCHGAGGNGGERASSIVDGSYLALVSDQDLRTVVIAGRPEIGAPDWRGDVPGRRMSAQDVSDVVAWLGAHRVQFPGQPYAGAVGSEGGNR